MGDQSCTSGGGTRSLAVRRTLLRSNRQLCLAVLPTDPHVVYTRKICAQQAVDAAIAEAPTHLCDLDDLHDVGAELLSCLIGHR